MGQLGNTIINGKLTVNGVINVPSLNATYAVSAGYANTAGEAIKLRTNAGSASLPVYFSEGVPVQCSTKLGVSITGTAESASYATYVGTSSQNYSYANIKYLGDCINDAVSKLNAIEDGETTVQNAAFIEHEGNTLAYGDLKTAYDNAASATSDLNDLITTGNKSVKYSTYATQATKTYYNYSEPLEPGYGSSIYDFYYDPDQKGFLFTYEGIEGKESPSSGESRSSNVQLTFANVTEMSNWFGEIDSGSSATLIRDPILKFMGSGIDYSPASGRNTYLSHHGLYTGGIVTANWVNTSSDVRLKENIKPIVQTQTALDFINNMNIYSFNYKEGNKQQNIGVIAQELENNDFNGVNFVSKANDYLTVKESKFVYVALQALKEQIEINQTLTDKIVQLEEKINNLTK